MVARRHTTYRMASSFRPFFRAASSRTHTGQESAWISLVGQFTAGRHELLFPHFVSYRRQYRRSSGDSYFTTCKWCDERIHMRQMPYGQWLAFNADDSVHSCDGPSGFDAMASPASHGLQPPTPPFVPKPAPKPAVSKPAAPAVGRSQKTLTPQLQKKPMPAWLDMLLGIILLIIILFLFSLFSKK